MSEGKIPEKVNIRRFYLKRVEDETGTSGTGKVAEGVEFSDGTTVVSWRSHIPSKQIYESIKGVKEIIGHEGKTKVVWLDDEPEEEKDEVESSKDSNE